MLEHRTSWIRKISHCAPSQGSSPFPPHWKGLVLRSAIAREALSTAPHPSANFNAAVLPQVTVSDTKHTISLNEGVTSFVFVFILLPS